MKKNILFACTLAIAAAFTSCSGDYMDASSKHVYSEVDEIPLSTSGAWETVQMEFPTTQLTTVQSIPLSNYAEDLNKQFGMTPEQVVSAINEGTLKFKVISSARSNWSTSSYTNNTGWWINASNKACTQEEAKASVVLNSATKALDIALVEGVTAGTSLDINVGIAKVNTEFGTYDKYVRFESQISVTDPTVIMASTSINIMADDYAYWELFFENNYDEQFKACLGMTAQEALDGVEAGTVGFYITDENGKYDANQTYTANDEAGYHGYWLDADAKICNWGNGSVIAAIAEMGERAIWFSVYPGTASRTIKIYCIFVLKSDPSKYIRVITNCDLK